jgi:hypothetical protein
MIDVQRCFANRKWKRSACWSAAFFGGTFFCSHVFAQTNIYAEYPQTRGQVQPLKWDLLPPWITLDVQLRGRTEGITAFEDASGNGRVYELTRVWGGLDVRPTRYLTGYLQFMDTHAPGLPLYEVASTMRDNFDLRQGYLEFHLEPVDLYAGRKELKFGDERVIGISDFINNSRTFDGFYGRFGQKNTLDLFSTSVVTVHPTSLDTHGAGLTFHGAWGDIKSLTPKASIQPYVLVKALPRVESQQKTYGSETEVTFGTEVNGCLPRGFDYDAYGNLQRGSYASDSIHAGSGLAKLAYRVHSLPWAPRVGGEWDFASGNAHRSPQRVSTFDQQYPSNHNAFGLEDLFGFENITQSRINIDLLPTKNLSFLVQQEFLHVASTRDSVYSNIGATFVKVPTAGFASDSIGRSFDASTTYVFHDYVVANAGIDHFSPGALMTENKHGAPLTYAYFSLTYRFKANRE